MNNIFTSPWNLALRGNSAKQIKLQKLAIEALKCYNTEKQMQTFKKTN